MPSRCRMPRIVKHMVQDSKFRHFCTTVFKSKEENGACGDELKSFGIYPNVANVVIRRWSNHRGVMAS